MGSGGVFSAEMPDEPSQPIAPLDANTAERLLSGRLDPDDAPPGYAEVARLLQAAATPADQLEPAGQAAAMDAFRTTHRPAQPLGRPGGAGGRLARTPGRPAQPSGRLRGGQGRRARGRLAALALAGVVVAGGVGVWTAGGAPFSRELRSPSGGPSAGGSSSGTSGSGPYGSNVYGSGAAGSLRPASPGLGSATGTAPVGDGRPPALPSARERATARHGGGVTSRGGGSPQGAKPTRPGKQAKPKPKPPKPKPPKSQASKSQASKS
jgi:hypothetical protein